MRGGPQREQLAWRGRSLACVVALGALAILIVSASLRPSPRGIGTHVQLGLWPCAWAAVWGKPCPSCGMTTAFAFAAAGDLRKSFLVHPIGAVLSLGASTAFWVAAHAALTASRGVLLLGGLLRPRLLWGFGAFWLLSWAYKVLTYES